MENIKLEIERKFLVKENWPKPNEGNRCIQGYISADEQKVVRVRMMDQQAWLTIKSLKTELTRMEFEIEISEPDAQKLMKLCNKPLIEKTRYKYDYDGFIWEIDEFHGANQGLVIAEIELEKEDQSFNKPGFIGEEVSHQQKYYNAMLTRYPYSTWSNHP
ncbi:MAG: CYTH domain-containing protein [Fidelibacterota bacterium]